MLVRTIFYAALLLPGLANAKDIGCKGNPKLTGSCYQASGEIVPSADVGYVFAVAGNPKAKAIRAAPRSDKDLPWSVADMLNTNVLVTTVMGDFVVCPIPEQPSQFHRHEVQFVCIESAQNVVVQSHRTRVEPNSPLKGH